MASRPSVYNSLAEYARAKGVKPATVRQWKRRGLLTIADGKIMSSPALSVTERDVIGQVVTERDTGSVTGRDEVSQSVTNYCRECAHLVTERDRLADQVANFVTECDRLRVELSGVVTERDSIALEADRLRSEVLRLERAAIGAALSQFDDQAPLTPDEIATLDASIDLAPDWGA